MQLDDGRELAPRRVPDHHQLALDDDRLRDVQALVMLAPGKRHDTQRVTSAGGLDAPDAGNIVGARAGKSRLLLRNAQDEDAIQATFLVLARMSYDSWRPRNPSNPDNPTFSSRS